MAARDMGTPLFQNIMLVLDERPTARARARARARTLALSLIVVEAVSRNTPTAVGMATGKMKMYSLQPATAAATGRARAVVNSLHTVNKTMGIKSPHKADMNTDIKSLHMVDNASTETRNLHMIASREDMVIETPHIPSERNMASRNRRMPEKMPVTNTATGIATRATEDATTSRANMEVSRAEKVMVDAANPNVLTIQGAMETLGAAGKFPTVHNLTEVDTAGVVTIARNMGPESTAPASVRSTTNMARNIPIKRNRALMGMAARVTKALTVAAMFILVAKNSALPAAMMGILEVRQAMVVPLALGTVVATKVNMDKAATTVMAVAAATAAGMTMKVAMANVMMTRHLVQNVSTSTTKATSVAAITRTSLSPALDTEFHFCFPGRIVVSKVYHHPQTSCTSTSL